MDFLYLFIPILGLIALGFILMSIRVLLKKNGRFSSQHIGQSRALKKRGIHCAQTQDKLAQKGVN